MKNFPQEDTSPFFEPSFCVCNSKRTGKFSDYILRKDDWNFASKDLFKNGIFVRYLHGRQHHVGRSCVSPSLIFSCCPTLFSSFSTVLNLSHSGTRKYHQADPIIVSCQSLQIEGHWHATDSGSYVGWSKNKTLNTEHRMINTDPFSHICGMAFSKCGQHEGFKKWDL